jgi:hypothetical protein
MAPKPAWTAIEYTCTSTQNQTHPLVEIRLVRLVLVVETRQDSRETATSSHLSDRVVPPVRRRRYDLRHGHLVCPNRIAYGNCRDSGALHYRNDVRHRRRLYLADYIPQSGAEKQSHNHRLHRPNGNHPRLRTHWLPPIHTGLGGWGPATSVGDLSSRGHTW